MKYYLERPEAVLTALDADPGGLTGTEAERRLA